MKKQKMIYICGKYSDETEEKVKFNVSIGEEIAKAVLLIGHIPILSYKVTHGFEHCEPFCNWKLSDWLRVYNFPLIDRSDGVLLCPNWENSKGAKKEVEYAKKKNKPIYKNVQELFIDKPALEI